MSNIAIPESLITRDAFLDHVPKVPQGKYAHLIILRETESFPIFQTDGSLNVVKVRAGLSNDKNVMRIVMFKRKQIAPERLVGRELLRRHSVTQADDPKQESPAYCEYNEKHCQQCPDCVYYGFAIGESGSEKSKVYMDSAFSVTGYDESHKQFSFNALFEKGNMSQEGVIRASFGEQDHVLPQVFFPSVVTIKDVTLHSFIYVLNNVIRTKRYGATGTRTGKMINHLVGVVFADGEIFSNLKLTQRMYDLLAERKQMSDNPLNVDHVRLAMHDVLTGIPDTLPPLFSDDGVHISRVLTEDQLNELINQVIEITTDNEKLNGFLNESFAQTKDYYNRVIAKPARGRGTKT